MSRDEVSVASFNTFRTFRDGMLNIPDRLAAVLAAETDPVRVHDRLLGANRDDARTHFDKAAALVTETGYHRRDPELAELRAALEDQGA